MPITKEELSTLRLVYQKNLQKQFVIDEFNQIKADILKSNLNNNTSYTYTIPYKVKDSDTIDSLREIDKKIRAEFSDSTVMSDTFYRDSETMIMQIKVDWWF